MERCRCKCGLLQGEMFLREVCPKCGSAVSTREIPVGEEVIDYNMHMYKGRDAFGKPATLLECRCEKTVSSNRQTVCKYCNSVVCRPVRVDLKFKEVE